MKSKQKTKPDLFVIYDDKQGYWAAGGDGYEENPSLAHAYGRDEAHDLVSRARSAGIVVSVEPAANAIMLYVSDHGDKRTVIYRMAQWLDKVKP